MHRRRLALAAAAASALTLSLLPAVGSVGSAGAADPAAVAADEAPAGSLTLMAPQRATLDYYGEGEVYGDMGLRIAARGGDVRVTTRRASYDVAPVTTLETAAGSTTVPRRMIRGFDHLKDFIRITVRDRNGKAVERMEQDMCLNSYQPQRLRPESPARSPYPYGCPWNPFTLGAVQGITDGYGVGIFEEYAPLPLEPGRYTVTAAIPSEWRSLMGMSDAEGRASFPVRVKKASGGDGWFSGRSTMDGRVLADRSPDGRGVSLRNPALPNAEPDPEPADDGAAVPDGPLPDLRSLPAFGIDIGPTGHHLVFGATVWNAGDSPLVVDGFRQSGGMPMMDSYQYFYDADGEQTGYQRVGVMHWHDAPSHNHWHFLDFARYSLLSKDGEEVFRSRKMSFCLANTDAVDLTLPGADWQPDGTDLSTACGGEAAQSVRQVLSAGSGDTYGQYRAGQSLNLDGLPNGQYWIAVQANPEGNLVEHDDSYDDNTALRKVWIGGRPGKRTVRVAPVGMVKAP